MNGTVENRQYSSIQVLKRAESLGIRMGRKPSEHVYVCGYKGITSLGDEKQTFEKMLAGETGISKFDVGNFRTSFAAPIKLDLTQHYSPDELENMSYVAAVSDFLTRGLIQQAGIAGDDGKLHPEVRTDAFSLCIGSGLSSTPELIDVKNAIHAESDVVKGSRRVDGRAGRRAFPQEVVGQPSRSIGAQGDGTSSTEACATGLSNLVILYRSIKGGYSDAGIGGGVEALLSSHPNGYGHHPEVVTGIFAKMHATSAEKENAKNAIKPLSADRDGMALGEGGALLLFAGERFVDKHKLTPLAEVLNADKGMDAHHATDPLPQRVAKILLKASEDEKSGKFYKPDLYAGHFTGTKVGDQRESEALELAFGPELSKMWILAGKRFWGHQLGAAAAVTAMVSLLCMKHGKIPGVVIENLDPRFSKNRIAQKTVAANINISLASGFGFGGLGAAMSFGKV